MASGAGQRFGGNKLLARVEGASLIERAFLAYPPALFSPAAVVSRYPEILSLAEERGYLALPNPGAEEGISASIRAGMSAMEGTGGALFAVCDQPWLRLESVKRVLAAFASHPGKIAALAWRGRKGNPCLFPAEFYGELRSLMGDQGGGAVIKAHPDRLLLVEAASEQELRDVDFPGDLQ